MNGWHALRQINRDDTITKLAAPISTPLAGRRSDCGSDRHCDADTAEPCLRHARRSATAGGSLRQHPAVACVRALRQQHDTCCRSGRGGIADDSQCAQSARDSRIRYLCRPGCAAGADVRSDPADRRRAASGFSRLLPQPPRHQRFHFGLGDSDRDRSTQIPAGYFSSRWQRHRHPERTVRANFIRQWRHCPHRYRRTDFFVFCPFTTRTVTEITGHTCETV